MHLNVKPFDGILGIAVSGGMDSMALLHAYLSIGQPIAVVNVEHGIRGESSQSDTAFVRAFCEKKNIPFYGKTLSVPSSALPGESVETCARRLRYAFFDELISFGKVGKIALAHHADDNAETVLMHIFRGTGIRGLIGIPERENYLRPLLSYTKKDIETYIQENNIPFVTDETNTCSDYTRNFLRNDVLPLIRSRYPDVEDALARLSSSAEQVDSYLSSICPKAEKCGDEYILKELFRAPEILQRYAIMQTIREMGYLQDFETRHVESVLSLRDKPNNTSIDLPFSLTCFVFNYGIVFYKKKEPETFCDDFSAEKTYVFHGKTYSFKKGETLIKGCSIDEDTLPDFCVVRTKKDGDVFKRVNGKTKLLSDFLNDKKLTKSQKEDLLVLAKNKDVFAILGLETSDRVKVTENTKKILHIITECTYEE